MERPWLEITARGGRSVNVPDGAVSEDGRIWGCYIHGLFENRALRRAWLADLGWPGVAGADRAEDLMSAVDRLADVVEAALDMRLLEDIVDKEALR